MDRCADPACILQTPRGFSWHHNSANIECQSHISLGVLIYIAKIFSSQHFGRGGGVEPVTPTLKYGPAMHKPLKSLLHCNNQTNRRRFAATAHKCATAYLLLPRAINDALHSRHAANITQSKQRRRLQTCISLVLRVTCSRLVNAAPQYES